jgi:hypothetical protein
MNKSYFHKYLDDSVWDTRKTPRLFEKGYHSGSPAAPRGRLRRSLKTLHESYGGDRVGPIILLALGLPLLAVLAHTLGWVFCVLIGLVMVSVWVHGPKRYFHADRDGEERQ